MQILATVTGAVVFTMNFQGPKPSALLDWFYFGVGAYLSGFLIQLCGIAVWAGYRATRKHIFPPDDALTPLQRELEGTEVRIVFCIALLVVCSIIFLNQHGVFSSLGSIEELTLR